MDVSEKNGLKLPREFGLLMKQALYFDRYHHDPIPIPNPDPDPDPDRDPDLDPDPDPNSYPNPDPDPHPNRYQKILAPASDPLRDPRLMESLADTDFGSSRGRRGSSTANAIVDVEAREV